MGGEVKVYLHAFLTSAYMEVSG